MGHGQRTGLVRVQSDPVLAVVISGTVAICGTYTLQRTQICVL